MLTEGAGPPLLKPLPELLLANKPLTRVQVNPKVGQLFTKDCSLENDSSVLSMTLWLRI